MDSETGDPVLAALTTRHSTPKVRADEVPRQLLEATLDAAIHAPNHFRTNPWRFIVLRGKARDELGNVMAESLRDRLGDVATPDAVAAIERERRKPLRAPVIVVVAAVASDLPKSVEVEEIAAVAASVEHILLAAEALGLGAMWRTGPAAYDPAVKRFLGLPVGAHIVSFVYLGYPDALEIPPRVKDFRPYTTWRGWAD
ncbi:MAG TPA: nitroreductase [Chloroflexota bacterium]|nr:nitroreductase [Chloroflexota bacterium]